MITWDQLCEDPRFTDLPYRIETDRDGNIIMSPHKRYHSGYQYRIQNLLARLLPGGDPWPEVPIKTSDGIKAADVAWISHERNASQAELGEFEVAPEICVEVLSPSNKRGEIDRKKALLFEAGASEFWVCHSDGSLEFYDCGGQLRTSKLCPEFPKKLET